MQRGFYTIMAAQFFSSLADNALFVVAVELLRSANSPAWQRAALVPMFALFYVVLAPFVGAFADALPKGRVMFVANTIKAVGCLAMLLSAHPLMAYAVVGLGAAAYSPAKYGILTELLPTSQLVKANGWIEGLTIASIILGVVLGGQLVGPGVGEALLRLDFPLLETAVDTRAEAAVCVLIFVYAIAAGFNLRIPRTRARLLQMPRHWFALLPDFWICNVRLWRDLLGQISLWTTTLFWSVSGNLRYIVLAWSAAALGYDTTQAANLVGVVAVGTAVGALLASWYCRLHQAPSVMPLGMGMGLLMLVLVGINNLWLAVPFLVLMGALGGYLVVPMNALLQHRGHNLMGAGRSIAVQNFNEQLGILLLGFGYTYVSSHDWAVIVRVLPFAVELGWDRTRSEHLSAYLAIVLCAVLVTTVMWWVKRRHARNLRRYPQETARQLDLARNDHLHG